MNYPLIHKPKHPFTLPQVQSVVVGEGKFIRQTGGDQYGHVILQLESNPEQNGCFMLWSVTDVSLSYPNDSIPIDYLESIYQGLCEAICEELEERRYSRPRYIPFPCKNTNVRIIGGSYHDVDSKEVSYRIATYFALADAVSKL